MANYTLKDVHNLIKQGIPCRIIDVREGHEFMKAHIPNAELIPLAQFSYNPQDLLPDPNELIFLHCASGYRSGLAEKLLRNEGYTQVYNVGAISEWPGEIISES